MERSWVLVTVENEDDNIIQEWTGRVDGRRSGRTR